MKTQKGFVWTPIVIAIAILVLGGVAYFGVKQYQLYTAEKIEKEKQTQEQQSALNDAKAEIEKLKTASEATKKEQTDLENKIEQTRVDSVKSAQASKAFNPDLSAIISEWRGRTAFLLCSGTNLYTNRTYSQSATAYVSDFKGGVWGLLTNKHAVTDDYGNVVTGCTVTIPGDPNPIYVSSVNIQLHPDPLIDAARVNIDNNDSFISSLSKKQMCARQTDIKINTGDQVIILGYPAIGSPTDITATEGIISGQDYPYYVTSAKIDHGNSGGLAILVKADCYFGIPSGAVVGSIESLGRILSTDAIAK